MISRRSFIKKVTAIALVLTTGPEMVQKAFSAVKVPPKKYKGKRVANEVELFRQELSFLNPRLEKSLAHIELLPHFRDFNRTLRGIVKTPKRGDRFFSVEIRFDKHMADRKFRRKFVKDFSMTIKPLF